MIIRCAPPNTKHPRFSTYKLNLLIGVVCTAGNYTILSDAKIWAFFIWKVKVVNEREKSFIDFNEVIRLNVFTSISPIGFVSAAFSTENRY